MDGIAGVSATGGDWAGAGAATGGVAGAAAGGVAGAAAGVVAVTEGAADSAGAGVATGVVAGVATGGTLGASCATAPTANNQLAAIDKRVNLEKSLRMVVIPEFVMKRYKRFGYFFDSSDSRA